jgi:hypothetical protein
MTNLVTLTSSYIVIRRRCAFITPTINSEAHSIFIDRASKGPFTHSILDIFLDHFRGCDTFELHW